MKVSGNVLAFILILSGFCGPRCGAAVYHSNGTQQSVQFIHDHQAHNGDTITLPTGTFSWTGTLTFTKAITLKGNTIRNNNGTSVDNTIVQDNIPRSTGKGLIHLQAPGGQRVTGISFVQGSITQNGQNGMIKIQGTTPTRIDHCVFDHLYWSPYVMVNDYNWGVLDHCTKRNPISNEGILHFRMGSTANDHGDTPFTQPTGYGGPNFFFVEDNLLWGGMDLTLGARVVVRHNLFMNANMASHGTGRTYRDGRGARACEIYDNEFRLNYTTLTGGNSGTVLVHDNLIKKYDGGNVHGINLGVNRRIYSSGPPFYGADGRNPWDLNATEPDGTHVDGHPPYLFDSGTISSASGNAITNSTKNWPTNRWRGYSIRRPSDGATAVISSNTNHTLQIEQWHSQGFAVGNTYEIRKVIRVLDQPGLGAQVGTMKRNNPRWMQQATEPCYSWNNTDQNNNPVNFTHSSGGESILVGRDYFNNTPMPGYTPYTYPHPLVTAVSDFNDDGSSDFVLQNASTHQAAIWYLDNNVFAGGAYGPTLPPDWSLVAVADFNRDGDPDFLLFAPSTGQTAIWYLSGPTFLGGAYGPTMPGGWAPVATADFNGDGNPDYVLYKASTGQAAIWYLDNNVFAGGAHGPTLPPGWSLVAVADFNRDGHPDYALFNSQTGQTAIWYLSGSTFLRGAFGPSFPSGWALVGAADFNRDGKPDYLLFNPSTHQTAIWYMNNAVFVSGAFGPTLRAGWSLVAP